MSILISFFRFGGYSANATVNSVSPVSSESSNASSSLTKTSMVNPKTNSPNQASSDVVTNEAYGSATYKASLMDMPAIENLTEKESAHPSQQQLDKLTGSGPTAALFSTGSPPIDAKETNNFANIPTNKNSTAYHLQPKLSVSEYKENVPESPPSTSLAKVETFDTPKCTSDVESTTVQETQFKKGQDKKKEKETSPLSKKPEDCTVAATQDVWVPTQDWVKSWKSKLPLQTIMRLLQVLVPQVEKICIDKGLTDESEILRFLQHGTLVGLLPVPHPILIRKYQPNPGTAMWFRTYLWGVIYLRNTDPPIWYDTDVKLFEIQRV